MQREITMHGVDFQVEFTAEGDIEALYIVGQEVSDVISDLTKDAIRSVVSRNAKSWAAEYEQELADKFISFQRAA